MNAIISYVDDLQKKVSSWYMAFKLHQQEHIAEMLEQAFEPVSSASSGLNESPAELFVEESCCTERQEMQDQIEYLQNNIADLVRRVQVLEEQYQAKPIPWSKFITKLNFTHSLAKRKENLL